MNFKILKSVDSLGKTFIDSRSTDPHCTYDWFKTMESVMKQDLYYVAVYCGENPVAVTPCFVDLKDVYFGNAPKITPLLKRMLVVANLFNLCNRYVLLCHSPAGCWRSKILFDENYDERLIMSKISDGIDYICKNKRITISSFLCVSASETNLMDSLNDFGYWKFFWRNTYSIKIQWKNFDEYLMSLNRQTRENIRRELRKSDENGVKIEVVSEFGHLSGVLSNLYSNLFMKYNKKQTSYYDASFFENLSKHAGDRVILFVATKKGKIVGFALCMRQNENLEGFKCGFDYSARSKNDFVYFNLAYYTPIKWAIENGIKEVYFGTGMERIKSKRGCKPDETFSFVKCHVGILDSLVRFYSMVPLSLKRKLA